MPTDFTPFASLVGGALIGVSAVLLMLGFGRILGATGIMSGLVLSKPNGEGIWRYPLVAGMVSAPLLLYVVTGKLPEVNVPISPMMIVIGGIIVGFGASLGSGCTSGHGVCGLSRLSLRSAVAVPVFMLTAAVTVYLIRHVIGG